MKRAVLNKILKGHRSLLKTRPLGGAGAEAPKENSDHLVAEALEKGLQITVCSPGGKKPDMRRRHRGY